MPIRSRIMFDAIESVIDAGIAGMRLIRVFSYHICPAIRSGLLRELLAEFVPPAVLLHIIHCHDEMTPLKERAFDFAAQRLQARQAL